MEEFGKEFDSFISLNLEKDDAEVFRRFKTAPEVWQYVCLKHHITQDRGKRTLLFIDEIQEVPEAVAIGSLLYLDFSWSRFELFKGESYSFYCSIGALALLLLLADYKLRQFYFSHKKM